MTIKTNLMQGSAPALLAQQIAGTMTDNLTATGSTQATALLVSDVVNVVTTTAASTGVVLPSVLTAGDLITVVNYGANALTVYPPVGGRISNGTINAGVSLAANKQATFRCRNSLDFISSL